MNFDKKELRSLFSEPFDEERWAAMLAELFGARQDPKSKLLKPTPFSLPDAQGWYLGSFTTADGYLVGLFRFETDSVRRRRVGLRNLLRPMLRGQHDAALAVFTERGSPAWRFSFVCDLKGDATAAKRFTYVFGDPSAPYRTPEERFLALRDSREAGKPVSFAAMTAAFSVEALSDEFFRQYKEHYETFVSHVTGKRFVKEGGKWVETEVAAPLPTLYDTFGRDDKLVRDYVKKLLGRLVFLHFLQKKGWMGAKNGTWTSGDPAFLLHLFERSSRAQKDDFLDAVLEKLFFEALNTDRTADGDRFDAEVEGFHNVRIPYLNGGLFERDTLDALRVRFPADFFGDLLRFFSDYNFTIDENDADEAEVGIDPEMLGRIFENLLEDNKDKGAFYTPKEIVRYMCRQSLRAHLSEGEDPATASAIATFLDTRDPGSLPRKTSARLAAKLRDIKICDPAIGSGAFPMGLLRELFALRSALEPAADGLKRQIIENNIYGVDIEKGAVDIARLRFWLALVVDADEPTPLPNLDFKIMQGNSLVESWKGHDLSKIADAPRTKTLPAEFLPGMPTSPRQLTLLDSIIDVHRLNLRDLLHKWFACSDHRERTSLRKKIHATVEDIFRDQGSDIALAGIDPSANTEFFLWHLWFANVFDNGGFDIVIGNPPYVLISKNEYKKKYAAGFRFQSGKIDLYRLFIEKAFCSLAKPGGIITYITPNTFLTIPSCAALRQMILEHYSLKQIINFPAEVFDSACVNNVVFLATTDQPSLESEITISARGITGINYTIRYCQCQEEGYAIKIFADPKTHAILAKMRTMPSFESLDAEVSLGIQPYHNSIHTKEQMASRFLHSDHKATEDYMPELGGRDMRKYGSPCSRGIWVDYSKDLYMKPDMRFFSGERIILREIPSKTLVATLTDAQLLFNKSCYIIRLPKKVISLRYLLGVLNSRAIGFWVVNDGEKSNQNLFPRITMAAIKRLPIPFANAEQQQCIARLVDRILSTKIRDPEADTTALESEIDALVYQLYGLTPDEIATVEEEK